MEQAAVRDVQEACVYDRMSLFLDRILSLPSILTIRVISIFVLVQSTLFLSYMPRCSTVFLVLSTLTL